MSVTDFDWIKPEVTTTEDVYDAYREWYSPEYRNPEAQAKWEAVNREEFDAWLASIKAEAWDEARAAGKYNQFGDRPRNPYRSES